MLVVGCGLPLVRFRTLFHQLSTTSVLLPVERAMNLRIRIQDGWRQLLRSLGVNTFLCGSCKFNDARYCRHRTRPHATICEDYLRNK